MKKEDTKLNGWDYAQDTEITLSGEKHILRMEQGMTGIGSRDYWIDGRKGNRHCVTQSVDLTQGNHFIYKIKWRDTPWDRVDIIIQESELPTLLTEENKWREPVKLY